MQCLQNKLSLSFRVLISSAMSSGEVWGLSEDAQGRTWSELRHIQGSDYQTGRIRSADTWICGHRCSKKTVRSEKIAYPKSEMWAGKREVLSCGWHQKESWDLFRRARDWSRKSNNLEIQRLGSKLDPVMYYIFDPEKAIWFLSISLFFIYQVFNFSKLVCLHLIYGYNNRIFLIVIF